MKILVDENIPLVTDTFARHGQVETYSGRALQAKHLLAVDALITRSVTKVNADLLSKARPEFIGTCTIGTDHLDIPLLESQSIEWASAPGCNAQSVVDYVLSVLAFFGRLELDSCGRATSSSNLSKPSSNHISSLTVGIVGCGNVGGLLRRRLIEIGFAVRVYDPLLDDSDIGELTSIEQVFQSDIVCLHTPFTTYGSYPTSAMVNETLLKLLPENACLISAGRGGVIVESDLSDFMQQRPDVKVAIDVWEAEPKINNELFEKVAIATPHIAGYSLEGKCRGTLQVYQKFCKAFDLEPAVDMDFIKTLEKKERDVFVNSSKFFVSDLLLSVYNPISDTERMRMRWQSATEQEKASGVWFDELRRNYPDRRELASFILRGVNDRSLNGASSLELHNYGFNSP